MPAKYRKSVLLIDDDPSDRKLFARLLRNSGFDVVETPSVETAIALIVGGTIGCVVTDQVMPTNGQEVAKSVQSVRGDVGVIFLSGAGPKKELPPDAVFVSKDDKDGLRRSVTECMVRWKIGDES
jgi:two-component system, HptB-dependent secretion and biofilm response regulator